MPLAVCATPIGNLDDVTLRVLQELKEADVVLCEDTRHTRVLLDRHGVRARKLVSYHRHNEAKRTQETLERLRGGERVALVSDAGLPGVSDPGTRLVAAARAAGLPVTALPGPSAAATALVASGLASDRYQFLGFLPRGEQAKGALWAELARWPYTSVAFESAKRLPASLSSLARALPERTTAVCRELTKRFEEVVIGRPVELAERFSAPPKGEIAIVVGPSSRREPGRAELDAAAAAVAELIRAGAPRRAAVDAVARLTGLARNDLYRASL